MRPFPPSLCALAALVALAACAERYPLSPELVASGAGTPYPRLVPAEQIVAQVPPAGVAPAEAAPAVTTRAERLRARAGRLRGPVLDAETQTRMQRGVGG
ncbi:hypothetical protein ABIE58_001427 [Roseovarius sp. MBR-78]|jgi:hypothetical protein|uniref:hypothetical protein n=1 Tax=Roseovarius sp. MBR-78 TaxID=3156460 RepID=UPI00339734DD